jgi:molybdenum cofactor cytidylyltransferase
VSLFGAVLAAGASTRLGRPKQLVYAGTRGPLVRLAAGAVLESGCARVAVVVGAFRGAVVESLRGLAVEVVVAPDFTEGMAASIRAASAWAAGGGAEALLLTVCDQPQLDAAHLRSLLTASEGGTRLAASAYAETLGVPAVFPSGCFAALAALRGERGAAGILRSDPTVASVPWPAGAFDLDTPSDLAQLETVST